MKERDLTGFARVGGRPRVLGHRGVRAAPERDGHQVAQVRARARVLDPPRTDQVPPENTIAAFEHAFGEGAEGLELDVRVCATGELVVLHDPTLTHVTSGFDTRAASALSWAELARVELAGGARVPTLLDALDFAREKGLPVNVELKRDAPSRAAIVAEAARVLGAWDPAHPILVSAFDPAMLAGFAWRAPRVARAMLVHHETWRRVALVSSRLLAADAVHLERSLATPELVARLHALGKRVNVWTVNDVAEARRLDAAGVDAIITDVPGVLREAFG